MRKSTIFITAVLTTFALAVLYGVVSAYQSSSRLPEPTPLPTETAAPAPEPTHEPTASSVLLSLEQAAQLAAQVVGNTDLLSAETSTFNGLDAYLVTFTNNDFVYVGLDGQILGVQVAPVVVNVSAPALAKHDNNSNFSNTGSSGESHDDHDNHKDEEEHEEHDEPEEHDD